LADILLSQGQPGEARELLERLYEYQPAAARSRLTQALLALAQAATGEENEDEQLALYERVLELDSKQPEAVAGRRRIGQQWGDRALKAGDLISAQMSYQMAGLIDKVAEVEQEIRRRNLASLLREIETLEQRGRYQEALELANKSADEYPERDWNADLERLENKTRLADLYQRALGALQSDDPQTAQSLLVEVVTLDPQYEEATRYLHLAVTGEDVVEIRRQLENEIAARQKAEAPAKKEAEARRQTRRNAGKKAEMPRTPSGLVIATPENLAQLLAQPEPPARVWWEQTEMELCRVEAGEFLMGSPEGQGGDNEHPQHAVRLDAYYMGRYPVTQAQYARFVRETGHRAPFVEQGQARPYNWDQKRQTPPKGREDHPVVLVSWEDAAAYCKWAGLRLPTEAEWEKAASWVGATLRGRPQGQRRIYPWGDEWDAKRCNTSEGGKSETTPVGTYSSPGDSPSGCSDMAGNAWEWCSSLYESYPYDPDDGRENLETSGTRVLRGGSWDYDRFGARSAFRRRYYPGLLYGYCGFRCCVSPPSFL
jgi:formylglycine-generating enzyme required for sulfatase activity